MTEHFIYFMSKAKSGEETTVHLADFDRASSGVTPARTLCGVGLTKLFEGDETPSGYLATCKSCRSIARLAGGTAPADAVVISRTKLARLRQTYQDLGRLVGNAQGDDPSLARRLSAEQTFMTATTYAVTMPCMLCDRVLTAEVRLDETSVPYKCICGVCSDKIDADVAAAQPVAP